MKDAFDRYKRIIFIHRSSRVSRIELRGGGGDVYDISSLKVVVDEDSEEVSFFVVFCVVEIWLVCDDLMRLVVNAASAWCG